MNEMNSIQIACNSAYFVFPSFVSVLAIYVSINTSEKRTYSQQN